MCDGEPEGGAEVGLDFAFEEDERADDICAVCLDDEGKATLDNR
jgi:hypothetical protein